MRKSLCTCAALLACLFGCDKMPENGALDGKWHLQEIHRKAQASSSEYASYQDTREAGIYWSFQLNLLSITSLAPHNGQTAESVARFTHTGQTLQITQTYIHFRDRDSLVTDPQSQAFESVGLQGCAATYAIRQLSDSQLILCSPLDSLVFYKIH